MCTGEDLLMPKEMHVPRTHRTDSIGYSCALRYSVDCVISRTVPFAQGSDPLFPSRSWAFLYSSDCASTVVQRETERVSPNMQSLESYQARQIICSGVTMSARKVSLT